MHHQMTYTNKRRTMNHKHLFLILLSLAVVACGKQSQQHESLIEYRCVTMSGDMVDVMQEVLHTQIIPDEFMELMSDEDSNDVQSNVNQYLSLPENAPQSLQPIVDCYNAIVMIYSLTTDYETAFCMETNLSKEIASMDCQSITDPSLRQTLENACSLYARAAKTHKDDDLSAADEVTYTLYGRLNAYLQPTFERNNSKLDSLLERLPYITNFNTLLNMRGKSDSIYQQEVITNYAYSKSFDEQCIWAIEFAHSDKSHSSFTQGAALLEEVMLKGQYSPYLGEVWTTWRAIVTDFFPMSNYGYIPNRLYNSMRYLCAQTFLQHLTEHPDDDFAAAMLLKLAANENIVRHGFIAGNSGPVERMNIFPEWEMSNNENK